MFSMETDSEMEICMKVVNFVDTRDRILQNRIYIGEEVENCDAQVP